MTLVLAISALLLLGRCFLLERRLRLRRRGGDITERIQTSLGRRR